MKHKHSAALTLAALLTVPSLPVFAAQPTGGVEVSTEDHNGLFDVTFTYVDKDAKDAVKVTVGGNLQWYSPSDPVVKAFPSTGNAEGAKVYDASGYKNGMINTGYGLNNDMQMYELEEVSDEVFTVTLSVPGNLYYYDYTITYDDGTTVSMQDPKNHSEVNQFSGHDSGHSLVYVGNSAATTTGQEAIYPEAAHKGTYQFVTYQAADGTTQPVGVYLPYGYTSSKTYPTLYISHGGGGNEAEWMGIGAVPNIMDNLFESQAGVEAVVVTMDNTYWKWNFDDIAKNFEENLIPFIESNYSVFTDRDHRAMCGLSMGSMTTSTLMQSYPHLFKYYGCFSGSNVPAEVTNLDLLKDSVIYLTAGSLDMALMNDSYGTATDRTTEGLKDKLDSLGVSYDFDTKPGAHDWGVWRYALTTFVEDYALKGADPIADGWKQLDNGDWMHHTHGVPATGWKTVNGRTYHFDDNHIMSAGKWIHEADGWRFVDNSGARKENSWLKSGGKWYYLGQDGVMAANTTIDGYTVDADGAWIE